MRMGWLRGCFGGDGILSLIRNYATSIRAYRRKSPNPESSIRDNKGKSTTNSPSIFPPADLSITVLDGGIVFLDENPLHELHSLERKA